MTPSTPTHDNAKYQDDGNRQVRPPLRNETGKFKDPKYLFKTTEYHYRRPSKTSWTSSFVSLTPNLYKNVYDYFRGRRPVYNYRRRRPSSERLPTSCI